MIHRLWILFYACLGMAIGLAALLRAISAREQAASVLHVLIGVLVVLVVSAVAIRIGIEYVPSSRRPVADEADAVRKLYDQLSRRK